ncbi:Polygalacturonase [Pirellulimonas nuda]|uniref:Polygalacturonase n=1 Tax=Pirellulimonas nuda TaxID=2528009 RepID=A0A518DG30_9BACT|nr:glycoside hydrolase family 28 protein [Pirellulimonas nuda]QDU90440.1 Polygalacturonase [Pirellulimonas nuda]
MHSLNNPLAILLVALGISTHAARASGADAPPSGWDAVPAILQRIVPPEFPDRDFRVDPPGGSADGKADFRAAISKAIDACSEEGGGRVVLGPGKWLSRGPVRIKSNVNLHLERGATLLFSAAPDDYLPAVFTRFEGTELMNFSPLVYAFEQENVAVTGEGTIDGQADDEHWWGWEPNWAKDIARLGLMVERGVPPGDRVFGAGHHLRPSFIQFYRCKNVLVEGVKVVRSPMWEIHPVLCENVTVRGVRIETHGPNNDGCNPECCRYVLIEDCYFDTGDDCIAIKSGRNADGRRVAVPSQDIIVRNCVMKDGHGGVVLGSEMSGGIRNVFVENCKMDSPHLERAIRLKSNSMRGGFLENLYVRDVQVGQVSDAVLRIDLRYWHPESGDFVPTVRNIVLERVVSQKSLRPMYLVGLPDSAIGQVHLRDCEFRNASQPSVIENVEELRLTRVTQPRE